MIRLPATTLTGHVEYGQISGNTFFGTRYEDGPPSPYGYDHRRLAQALATHLSKRQLRMLER